MDRQAVRLRIKKIIKYINCQAILLYCVSLLLFDNVFFIVKNGNNSLSLTNKPFGIAPKGLFSLNGVGNVKAVG